MNPMERELIEQLIESLEQVKNTASSTADIDREIKAIDQQLIEINKLLISIDRILRGFNNTPGLISRVQALERIYKAVWIIAGALGGSSITLLAAYMSKH